MLRFFGSNIILYAKQFFVHLLEFIYPRRCLMCLQFIDVIPEFKTCFRPTLCLTCWGKLNFIQSPCCERCAAPLDFDGAPCQSCKGVRFQFDSITAAIVYDESVKRVVTDFKTGRKLMHKNLLATWAVSNVKEFLLSQKPYDLLIPVPLHPTRLYMRGFNQSAYIAKTLMENIPALKEQVALNHDALKRVRTTKTQGHKSVGDRHKNVEAAFIADATQLTNKRVILLDDVMTTGATLNACARALKRAGVQCVHVIVVARAIKKT